MLNGDFMAGSAHIEQLDAQAEGFPVLRQTREAHLHTVMSNSFGFGGTNASRVFAKV
jgi:3-oxoacyl-[acyl-carrier-protein] synthase-1